MTQSVTSDLSAIVEDALDKLTVVVQKDFESTMQTWENHQSPVIVERGKHSRRVYVSNEIYAYLNNGTSVRRVLLSKDQRNKTAPRRIQAVGGKSGRVLRVLPLEKSFPGIVARAWDEEIAKHAQEELETIAAYVNNELARVAIRVFG